MDNPRECCDNLGKLSLFHNRYNLPNELELDSRDYSGWPEMEAAIRKTGASVVLPVYGYDHGGLVCSTQAEKGWFHYSWDGGQLGYIAAFPEDIRSWFGVKRITHKRLRQVREVLAQEVQEYCNYLMGYDPDEEPELEAEEA